MDSPIFAFSGPRICPWDLYASQYNDWKIEDQNTVGQIRKRLEKEKPTIELTAAEGKSIDLIRKRKDEYPFASLREVWWMRTLHGPENIDDEILMTMALYRMCQDDKAPVPELREVYRLRLLELFQKAITGKDTPREVRFRYQYLHAEFLRKGGLLEQARKEFLTFDRLLSAIPAEDRKSHEPLVTWTKEQLLKLEFQVVDSQSLLKKIVKPLPNPFRDDKEWGDSWLNHRWALEELVRRCLAGDQEASKQAWNLVGRDAGKLLAVAETISCPRLDQFSEVDARWEKWRRELVDQLKNGKVPEGAKIEINQERNVNILTRLVRGGTKEYLREAESEADTPEGRLRGALTIMEEGSDQEARAAAEKALQELRNLDWKAAKKEDMFDYPLQYLSKAFSLSGERFRSELEESLSKSWKDPFFKEMTRLWAGKPGALTDLENTEALKVEPKYPGYGPAQMVYFYLEARKDPAWEKRCLRDLKILNMLNDRVQSYARVVMTPTITDTLLERHAKLMEWIQKENFEADDWDWRPGEASDIEEIWREIQLTRLPLRIGK